MALNGAHHFGIGTAFFNTLAGSDWNKQFETLHNARAVEASYTSNTAVYAPKCKPGTRTKIISDIVDWLKNGSTPILWFSGPAGAGKTCIMREVAAQSQDTGVPVCTYFFSIRVSGLDVERPFVATIVHQLIMDVPALKPLVLGCIAKYPSIFYESLDFQMDNLITKPLKSTEFQSDPSSPETIIILIDGFDECRNPKERGHLLHLLQSLIEKVAELNIIIVLASRPELDLRMAFDSPSLKLITKALRLEDYDGRDDVRNLCCDEFAKIRDTHPLRKHIPIGWPIEEILDTLLDKSSGHFLLPSIIFKYINNPRRNPVDLLKRALSLPSEPSDDNPLAEIDALYSFILHPPETNIMLMKRILHLVLGMKSVKGGVSSNNITPSFFDAFLKIPSGTVDSTLCDLHSILFVPDDDQTELLFHHKSLEDYLLSPTRSRELFQAPYETQIDITVVCIRYIEDWAANPRMALDASKIYAADKWSHHLHRSLEVSPVLAMGFPSMILHYDPRHEWRFKFVEGFGGIIDGGCILKGEIQSIFHSVRCSENSCFEFCSHLARMDAACLRACVEFASSMRDSTREERLDALPLFDVETGLYDPTELVHN